MSKRLARTLHWVSTCSSWKWKTIYTLAASNHASFLPSCYPFFIFFPPVAFRAISRESHLPNSPENQLANCFPPILGVKLSTLSESPPLSLRSGVYGPSHGTVLPLGLRVGVDFRLLESLLFSRRLTDADFCVRCLRLECSWLGSPGVIDRIEVSMLTGVAARAVLAMCSVVRFSVDSTTRIVDCESWLVRLGECASICIGRGRPVLTHGRTV